MREVPFKNYIKLFLLIMVTISITIGISLIYQNYRKSHKSYLSKNIQNINVKELDIYLQENDYVIIFVTSEKDNEHDTEYENLVKDLTENDIKQYTVYLNRDKKENINYFKDTYNVSIENDMAFLIEDGKIKRRIKLKDYNMNEINNLLKGDFSD